MIKLYKNKTSTFFVLAILVLIISFPGLVLTAKAATPASQWTAQTLFQARPAATQGPDPLTPTQIINAYSLTSTTNGKGTIIAIVDAYDDPTIAQDLATFTSNFNLPTANFIEHKMSPMISANSGWAIEISLDVEWAHAIAPQATILLVEAKSSGLTDLLSAVSYATSYKGVVAVSMSWGGSEFSTESAYDSYFTSTVNPGIVFFASIGDNGAGVISPSSSPNVVSVGGTTLNLDPTTGAVTSETAWSGSGGGVSAYEPQPAYQTTYGLTNTKRSTPDVSYDADPNTGVYVYDSTIYQGAKGWWDVGGTSAGAPQWAAIQALGQTTGNNNFYPDATQSASSYFRDITAGSNGNPASVGYDLVTGLGSPITTNFSPSLTPDFTLSATPITINAGLTTNPSGTSTVTATFLNGYTNTITLSTSTMPNGWTASFTPNQLTASGTSSLIITIPVGTPTGTQPITITATDGTISHSATLTVQIINPYFTLSASPTSTSINAGSTGTSTITETPFNGFTDSVTLTTTSGWASFSPNPITTSGTLNINVPSGTPTGTNTFTITGTDTTTGLIISTTTVTVQVTNPDFSISAAPTTLNLKSGSSGSSTITIKALNGFSGNVALVSSAAPSGLTATLTPTSVTTSGSSALKITASSNAKAGTYTFTVTGTSGTLTHSTTVTVTISRFG